MSRPDNAIEEVKEKRRKERKQVKDELNRIKDEAKDGDLSQKGSKFDILLQMIEKLDERLDKIEDEL